MSKKKKKLAYQGGAQPVSAEYDRKQAFKRRKKTSKSRSRRAQSSVMEPTTSPLLDLPPELRNEIYRLVLVKDRQIRVTKRTATQPGITRVNRQTRQESLGIFLKENNFVVTVRRGLPEPPLTHWAAKNTSGITSRFKGVETWSNILRWLEMSHSHGYWCPAGAVDRKGTAIDKAFEMVVVMTGFPWEVVETVLEAYRAGLAAANPGWAWVKKVQD
ncbi:hypothetical protein EJ03DRAFT_371323 [Teratosphaeria nubilosa]|uniref:F-box domain-containing protein n=1 Tax=Teratosphaeria nubilosa TaxID=161662 RepID=A0A6G1LKB7_9PEZI|nr:hypothetical protein EJ03DRAFT_371323 [Teratosphaeria nubilosa]